jgi:hypothetical protein
VKRVFEIYNILGEKVKKGLKKGVYFLKGNVNKKIIVR